MNRFFETFLFLFFIYWIWANSVAFLFWRVNCIFLSFGIFMVECPIFHWLAWGAAGFYPKLFPLQRVPTFVPTLLTMGFWTEWIPLQLFVFNKNRLAVPMYIALWEQMSSSTRNPWGWTSQREKRVKSGLWGLLTWFGIAWIVSAGWGVSESCLQDPPCPAVGWGAALPGRLVVLLGPPLTSEFLSSHFFQGPPRNSVYSSQCSLWTESVRNICFLWPSATYSLGCGP